MPTEFRVSGPAIESNGQKTEPRAAVHICEECGYEGAAFGVVKGTITFSYCGWVNGDVKCVGKGRPKG